MHQFKFPKLAIHSHLRQQFWMPDVLLPQCRSVICRQDGLKFTGTVFDKNSRSWFLYASRKWDAYGWLSQYHRNSRIQHDCQECVTDESHRLLVFKSSFCDCLDDW